MPLPLRLSLLIALVVVAAVGITAALNFAKFTEVTDALDESRYAFLAADLKSTLESSLDLGLPLNQIENAQEVVDRQRERYPEILAVEVFDSAGTVLYASGRARPDLLSALGREDIVSASLDGDRVAATRLVNPFGEAVGGVAIRVSAADAQARERAMLASLGTAVVTAAALGVAAAAAVAVLLLGGVRRRLELEERIIAALVADGSSAGASGQAQAASPFHRAAVDALSELRDVERLVERAGEGR